MGWGDWVYDSVMIMESKHTLESKGSITRETDEQAEISTIEELYVEADFDRETGMVDFTNADIEVISTEWSPKFPNYLIRFNESTDDAYSLRIVLGRIKDTKEEFVSYSFRYFEKYGPALAYWPEVESRRITETDTYIYHKAEETTLVDKKTKTEDADEKEVKYPLQDGYYATLDGNIYDKNKSLVAATGLIEPVAFYEVRKGVYVLAIKSGNLKDNDLYLVQAGSLGVKTENLGTVLNKKLRPLNALSTYLSSNY